MRAISLVGCPHPDRAQRHPIAEVGGYFTIQFRRLGLPLLKRLPERGSKGIHFGRAALHQYHLYACLKSGVRGWSSRVRQGDKDLILVLTACRAGLGGGYEYSGFPRR